MKQEIRQISISCIIIDEDIYPRKGIDRKRVGMFSENIRDGFEFDPLEVEPVLDKPGWYRLLDGAHRWSAYKATGRARRTVDNYIADLRAVNQMGMDIKVFRMNRLGIPQDRVAKRLGQAREVIRDHLAEMATLPNPPNTDLSQGFTVSQVAQKHGWTESMVWSL
jgi:hypothetical protein